MPVTSLQDLYLNKLQLMFDAERQILEALPQVAQVVRNSDLRLGLEAHRRQTEDQVRRLEQIFQRHGQGLEAMECVSMRALIQEAQQLMPEIQDPDTLDAFLIGAQQAVEHHEIAAYGTARTWARQLGHNEDADLLQQILQEEEGTDKMLTDIAERMVNPEAAQAEGARLERDVTPSAQPADAVAGGAGRGEGAGTVGAGMTSPDSTQRALDAATGEPRDIGTAG